MQLALEQTFPFGRFHATPWKVFPYDDPHGEWPPSPWRLVRAILARSYQLDREVPNSMQTHRELREAMVRAFASSTVSWQLPASTWRGPGLRQYVPSEFKRVPAPAKEPGMMSYNTTKVLDNFWLTPGISSPLVWLFEGANWGHPLLAHIDSCLARMIYFGRAESITEIRRLPEYRQDGTARTCLYSHRTGRSVPVLTLDPNATLSQLEATTDTPSVATAEIPTGSRWMFAERPQRPRIQTISRPPPELPRLSLIQFAIGSNVSPSYRDAVLVTERFRQRVLKCFTRNLTNNSGLKWKDESTEILEKVFLLSGKKHDGSPAENHRHVSFFLSGTPEMPSRLCAWRGEQFTFEEQRAILEAANEPLPLNAKSNSWMLNLVPLDRLVPEPPGLSSKAHREWKSLTLYVPPRHVFGRSGKVKPGCSVSQQLVGELESRGFPIGGLVVDARETGWAKVHRVKAERDSRSNNDKLGYSVHLSFREPVKGPISLGSSSHFGLGFFVPCES